MKVKFKCGCGMYNHTLSDWLAHWKYGKYYPKNWQNKLRAIQLFLITKIELKDHK